MNGRAEQSKDANAAAASSTLPSFRSSSDHSVVDSQTAVAPLARFGQFVGYFALITAGYYLAARLGMAFRFQNSQIGVVWPPNAVLLAALLLTPRTRWWMVLAGTALAHVAAVSSVAPAWRMLWQIAGNAVFTISTVEVLRRVAGLPLHFESRRQVLAYTAVSFAMPTLYGFTTPAFVRSLLHLESNYSPAVCLLRTALSNSTALLLVAPAILLWAGYGFRRLREMRSSQFYEAVAIMISLLSLGLLALGTGPDIARLPWVLLWVFPPLLWAAVRFGPLGASTALFFVAALSVWGASRQLGSFVLRTDAEQVLSLQLFWMALCPPVALLAAVIRERDLAEHALLEQRGELAHVTRVATAGELSAALAHELRQPLTSIFASAAAARDLLSQRGANLKEVQEILDEIIEHNKQASGIIERVQSFVKKDVSHFETLAIEMVVRDALALGRSAIVVSGVVVHLQIAGGLPRVHGDPVQLLQVMLNLIVNACESMRAVPEADRELRLQVARTADEHVEVLIEDRGVGLPGGAEDRVFEPFFTTKEKGLGLGLAIGRSIATAHGGRLWAENNPAGGATFHLILPRETLV